MEQAKCRAKATSKHDPVQRAEKTHGFYEVHGERRALKSPALRSDYYVLIHFISLYLFVSLQNAYVQMSICML